MAPRTVYANLTDGLQPLNLFDQSLADMGTLGIIPCTASGTNAIVLTPIPTAFTPTVSIPNQLQSFSFVATATSTGAITVQIGTAAALNLYKEDGATQASTGDLVNKVLYGITYNSALNSGVGGYQIAFPITSVLNPVISGATISNSTITTSTYNGNTWTAGTGTLTIAAGKTLTANNTLTLAGTDSTTMTFPGTSDTVVGLSATQTLTNKTLTSPSLTTPSIGAATATSINGNTLTAGSWTLTGGSTKTFTFNNSITLAGVDGKTLTANNSLTFAGTDATTITFQGTDTYIGRATTDTLTNKTFDTAGTGNVFKINGTAISTNTGTGANVLNTAPVFGNSIVFSPSTGGIIGTSAADSATAGIVGEVISSTVAVGSAVSLITGTPKTVTSITLTAGDWDVMGSVYFTTGGTTTVSLAEAFISNTTNVIPTPSISLGGAAWFVATANAVTGATPSLFTGVFQQNVSTSTSVFLVAQSNFGTSTQAAYGTIWARRRR